MLLHHGKTFMRYEAHFVQVPLSRFVFYTCQPRPSVRPFVHLSIHSCPRPHPRPKHPTLSPASSSPTTPSNTCKFRVDEKVPKDTWTCPVCRKKKQDAEKEAKVQAKRDKRKRELEEKQAKARARTVRWHGARPSSGFCWLVWGGGWRVGGLVGYLLISL